MPLCAVGTTKPIDFDETNWPETSDPRLIYVCCRGHLLGQRFCVIWLLKRPASGWGLLWESSSFVPWLILNTFQDVSGPVPEWPWNSGFMRKSSRRANAPSTRFSVLLNSCDVLFSDSSLNFLRNLSYVVLLWSRNILVLR